MTSPVFRSRLIDDLHIEFTRTSQLQNQPHKMPPSTATLRAAILVISDTAFADSSTDKAGPTLKEVFQSTQNSSWEVAEIKIVPDDVLEIQRAITTWADGVDAVNCIITSGGTGFAVRDKTPEVSSDGSVKTMLREVLIEDVAGSRFHAPQKGSRLSVCTPFE